MEKPTSWSMPKPQHDAQFLTFDLSAICAMGMWIFFAAQMIGHFEDGKTIRGIVYFGATLMLSGTVIGPQGVRLVKAGIDGAAEKFRYLLMIFGFLIAISALFYSGYTFVAR